MKEETKKTTKPTVKVKDLAPKKDAKGGSQKSADMLTASKVQANKLGNASSASSAL